MLIPEDVGRYAIYPRGLRYIEHPLPLPFRHARIVNLSGNQQFPPALDEERTLVEGNGIAPLFEIQQHSSWPERLFLR